MARRHPACRHYRSKRRRRLYIRMGSKLRRPLNYNFRPGVSIHVRDLPTVDKDLGHQSHHDRPLPSRSEWDGGEASSQTQGVSRRSGSRGTTRMVLATAMRNARHQDNGETGHRIVPSGLGLRRGVGSPRRAFGEGSPFRQPTTSSARISTRGPSTRGCKAPAYRDICAQKASRSPSSGSAKMYACFCEKRRRSVKPRVTICRPIPSSLQRPSQLQSCNSRATKRDGGDLSGKTGLFRI